MTDIPEETWRRFILQVVGGAGPEGLNKEELDQAADLFEELYVHAALVHLWEARQIDVSYRNGELNWRPSQPD
jgi:hypothetical protein